jgi:hypothetical protein
MESDYGLHEEGFKIVENEGPAATFEHDRTVYRLERNDPMWPRGASLPDGPAHWPGYSPLKREMLLHALPISNHDAVHESNYTAWNATVDSVADDDDR